MRCCVRFANWVHPGEIPAALLWAGVVGCLGGVCALLFRELIQLCQWLFTQHTGSFVQTATELPWWQRLATPAVGGLLAGLVLRFGSRFVRAQRSADYMEALAIGDGIIRVRPSLVKSASSLLSISSGASIGREGAMVQLAATLASWLGRRLGMSTPSLRLLVACGTAAGIASVYNAPIAGALFVAEVILGSIAMESFGPLVLAAVMGTLTSRYLGGPEVYFASSTFQLISPWEVIPYMILALGVGLIAPWYVRLLRKSEDVFARLAPPICLRFTLGGIVVGLISILCPEVWGNGRSMVTLLLKSTWPWTTLGLLLLLKLLATSATVGSGAVGGIFTPTLLIGALLGGLLGHAAGAVWPNQIGGPEAYALVGMGGFLAATTRAPLMSMLMVFEMTLDYGVVLPLMLVSVTAYFTARRLDHDSIYSDSLRRKQSAQPEPEPLAMHVSDLMKPPPPSVRETAPFSEVARFFASHPYNSLQVVSENNRLRGVIVLHDVKNNLQETELAGVVTASDLMHIHHHTATPETRLLDVLELFKDHAGERLPVVNNAQEQLLIGSISKTDLMLTLAHRLQGAPRSP